jgi:hypothetical protein
MVKKVGSNIFNEVWKLRRSTISGKKTGKSGLIRYIEL